MVVNSSLKYKIAFLEQILSWKHKISQRNVSKKEHASIVYALPKKHVLVAMVMKRDISV